MADTQKINLKALIDPIEIDIKTGKLDSASKKLKEFYGYIQEIREELAVSDSWGDPIGLANQYGIVINTLKEVNDLIKQMEKESGRLAGQIAIIEKDSTEAIKTSQTPKVISSSDSSIKKESPKKTTSSHYTFKGDISTEINGRTEKIPGFIDNKGGTRFIADIQKSYFSANEEQKKIILQTFKDLFYSQETDIQKWMLAELRRPKGTGYNNTVQDFWDELKKEQTEEMRKAFNRASKGISSFSFEDFGYDVGASKGYQAMGADWAYLAPVALRKGKKKQVKQSQPKSQAPYKDPVTGTFVITPSAEQLANNEKIQQTREGKTTYTVRKGNPEDFSDMKSVLQIYKEAKQEMEDALKVLEQLEAINASKAELKIAESIYRSKQERYRSAKVEAISHNVLPEEEKSSYKSFYSPSQFSYAQLSNSDFKTIRTQAFYETKKMIDSINKARKKQNKDNLNPQQIEELFQAITSYFNTPIDERNKETILNDVVLTQKLLKPFLTVDDEVVPSYRLDNKNNPKRNETITISSEILKELENRMQIKTDENENGLLSRKINGATDRQLEAELENLIKLKELEFGDKNLNDLTDIEESRLNLLNEAINYISNIFIDLIEQGFSVIENGYSKDIENINSSDEKKIDFENLFSLSDNVYSQFVKRFLSKKYTLNSDGTKTPTGEFLTDTEELRPLREEIYEKITQLMMERQKAFDSQGWSGYSWGLLDKDDMLSLGLMTDDRSESLEGLRNAGFANQSQLDLEESMRGTDFKESRSIAQAIEQAAFRLSNLLVDYQAYQASIAEYAKKTNQTYEEVDKKARENMSDVALDNLDASKIVRQIYDTTNNKFSGQINEKYEKLSKLSKGGQQYNELLNEIRALETERNKEIIKALRSANTDNRELEEILKMIQGFSGQSLFTEEFRQFSQKFNNQMSVGRSFKSGKKIPITKVTPGVDKEFWDTTGLEETPAMRRALNYSQGYAKLAPYGVTSLQEAINIINQRDGEIEQERLDLEEKNKNAIAHNEEIDRKIQEAEESIRKILETYGTKEQKDWAITRPDLSSQKIGEDRATYNKAVDFLKNHTQKEEIIDIPDRKAEMEQLDRDREEFMQLLEKAKQREQERERTSINQSKENDTKDTSKSDLPQEPKVSERTSQTIETEIAKESDVIGKESPILSEHNSLMGKAIEKEVEKTKVANALADALKKEKDAFDELNNSVNSHNESGQTDNSEQPNNSNNNGPSNYRGFKKNTANTVKVERLPIFFDAKNHTYIDEIGNKVMFSTKFRDILLGKDRTSIKSQEDIKRIKDASNSLNRPLSATDVGMSQSDFDFYTKNVIGSALYGDYFHAIIDNFAKTGQVDLNTLKKETETELAKYNINPDEFLGNIEANVKAYLEAYEKIGKALGLTLSQFSEMPLGARLETANGIYEIAGTLDQLLIDQNGGGAFIDNKTGKVHGYEAFQLTFQKILALANQDWLNQNGIIKDSEGNAVNVDFNKVTSGYIAKIENGVVTYIENKLLELEEFADLIDRASRVKEGKANPLNSNEVNALMNRQLATGRFQGGTNAEDIIIPNNKETDGKIVSKAIQERLKYYKEFLNAEKELYKWQQKAQTLGDDATDEQKQAYGDKIKYLEQLRDIAREILNETDFTSKDGKWYANGKEISEEDFKNYQRESRRLNLQYQNNKSSVDITEAKARSKGASSSNVSSSTKNAQVIKDLIKQKKDLANYEKGLQQAELNYSQLNPAGQREMLKTIDYYKKRINELQNSGLKFDREKGSIITDDGEELLLNAQEIREIETQIGDIENKKQNDIAKQNIKYKEQRGILTQIVDSFKNEFRNLFDYRIGNEIINAFQNGVRRVINLTKELNSNMVDLQIASGESYNNIYELSKSFNDLGRELGRSTSDVMTAANDWLRAGYNAQKAAELTRASMELSTLGMISSSDATSYLISTMKGWKLEASEVSNVVDKLTAIDFQAAVSAGDLAEAISRSSVSAQKAGLDLDTFLGYVTVVQETTQKSAEVVGSSFQTLFSRYQNAAAGKFSATQEEMESGDYDEENYSNINDIEKALKAVGINIRDTIDHFRDFDEIIQEIASRWNTFSNVQQAGLSTSLAGTRQRENFLVLMENFDSVSRYAKIAAESQGTATEKMKAYTDSIEAAQQRTTVALEQLALDLNLTDAIKNFYNVITYLTDNIEKVAIALAGIIALTKGGDILSSVGTGFISLSNKSLKLNNAYSNFFSGGVNTGNLGVGIKNFKMEMEDEQKNLVAQKYIELMNRRAAIVESGIKVEAEQLQTKLKEMNLSTSQYILDNKLLILNQQEYNAKIQELEYQGILKQEQIEQIQAIRELTESSKNLAGSQKEAALETSKMRQEEESNIKNNFGKDLAKRTLSLGGFALGSWSFGSAAENLLGEGWGTIGTTIGSQLGMYAGQSLVEGVSKFASSKSLLSALSSIGPLGAVAIATTVATSVYSAYKQAESKALKEAKENFTKVQEEFSQAISNSVDVGEYDKLVKGVDSLGRNISLTEEEYQKFLEISNQLAEAFPDMVQRVDSSGNKLLGTKGKVGEITNAIDELVESLRQARAEALLAEKDLGGIFGFFGGKTSQLDEAIDDYQKALNAENSANNKVKVAEATEKIKLEYQLPEAVYDIIPASDDARDTNQIKVIKEDWEEYYNEIIDSLEEQLENRAELDNYTISKIEKNLEETKKEKEEARKIIEELNNENYKNYDSVIGAKEFVDTTSETTKQARKELDAFIDAYIDADPALRSFYNNLSDEMKQFYDAFKGSFDLTGIKNGTEMKEFLSEQFKFITDMISENPEIEEELKVYYDLIPTANAQEYIQERDKLLDTILNLGIKDESQLITILQRFQFVPVYDEEGNINGWKDETNIFQSIEEEGLDLKLSDGSYNKVKATYTQDEIKLARDFLKVTNETNISYERLNEQIANMQYGYSSSLTELADGYEDLNKKSEDTLTDIQKEQKRIIEKQLNSWAKELNVPEGEYDKIIEKIRLIGDLTAQGTSTDSLESIQEQAEDLQNYVDYLINDFDGKTWDFSKFTEIFNNEKYREFIQNNDISGLIKAMQSDLDTLSEKADQVYQQMLLEVDDIAKNFYETNQDAIKDFQDKTGMVLDEWTDLQDLIAVLNNETITGILSDYSTWVLLMAKNYEDDYEAFAGFQANKLALTGAMIDNLKMMAGLYNVSLPDYLTPEQLTKDYDKYVADNQKRGREGLYKTYEEYRDARLKPWQEQIQQKAIADAEKTREATQELMNNLGKAPKSNLNNIEKKDSSSSEETLPDESWKLKDRLEALEGLIDKEWEAMKVFDEMTGTQIKETEYFDKMAESLNARLAESIKQAEIAKEEMLKAKEAADKYGDAQTKEAIEARNELGEKEKEYIELQKEQIEIQKQINNLDDEELEDKIKIAETLNLSIDSLIELNKQLLGTADTEEERVERNAKILDLLKEQYKEQKRIRDYYADYIESTRDLYSGSAFSNKADYDTMMNYRTQYSKKNIEEILKERDRLYSERYETYLSEGKGEEWAKWMAENSEEVQEKNAEYLEEVKKQSDLLVQNYEDKIAELDQKLDDLEKARPKEWSGMEQIKTYYSNTVSVLTAKLNELYIALQNVAFMTDEQIQDLVNQINDVTIALQEAKISMQEDLIEAQDKQFTAIINQIERYKDDLQDQIDAIEKAYEDEITPIKEANDERERAITLEEKL